MLVWGLVPEINLCKPGLEQPMKRQESIPMIRAYINLRHELVTSYCDVTRQFPCANQRAAANQSTHIRLLQILHCHDFTKMHANYMRAQPTVRNEEQREPGKSFDVIKNRATCLLVKLHFSPQISIDNIKNAAYFVKYTQICLLNLTASSKC